MTEIIKTAMLNNELIHLRDTPACIKQYLYTTHLQINNSSDLNNSDDLSNLNISDEDKISYCICQDCNYKGDIQILSYKDLLSFSELKYTNFPLLFPLSSLRLLEEANPYVFKNLQFYLNLKKVVVFPDIFCMSLFKESLEEIYSETFALIYNLRLPSSSNEIVNDDQNNINELIKNGLLEVRNLSLRKEIKISDEVLNSLCEKNKNISELILNEEIISKEMTNKEIEDDENYLFINLFKIPYINSDKLLCVDMKNFNELEFVCSVHSSIMKIEESLIKEDMKILIPLKVVSREECIVYTEILDLDDESGAVLLKRISSGDRILSKLDYEDLENSTNSIKSEDIIENSNEEDIIENSNEDIQNYESSSLSEEKYEKIFPIVELKGSEDISNMKINLKCQIDFSDEILKGQILEISHENNYEILLKDLQIKNNSYEFESKNLVEDFEEKVKEINHKFFNQKPYNENTKKNITNKEENRIDNTNLLTLTVDPLSCVDIDDALSIKIVKETNTEKITENKKNTLNFLNKNTEKFIDGFSIELYIHIADLSFFIKENTEIDERAFQRATSFYFNNKRIDMIPEKLSSNYASLRVGVERNAFTVKIVVFCSHDLSNFYFIDYAFMQDKIINKCKLSYEKAEDILKGQFECPCEDRKEFKETDVCVSCIKKYFALSHNFTMQDVRESLKILKRLSEFLKNKRGLGALEKFMGKSFLSEEILENEETHKILENEETHSLIEEMMLLANQLAASEILFMHQEKSLLRVHKENELEDIHAHKLNIKRKIMQQMNQAKYRFSDFLLKNENNLNFNILNNANKANSFYHFGLNIPFYTHFTSPIRRYADLIVHRLLKGEFNRKNKNLISRHLNKQTMKGKILNRISKKFEFIEKHSKDLENSLEKIKFRGVVEEKAESIFSLKKENKEIIKIFLPDFEVEGFLKNGKKELKENEIYDFTIESIKGGEIFFELN